MESSPHIFISAAEQSADEHAADLIRAFREQYPAARFSGLAGPAMQAAGCERVVDFSRKSAMALGAFKRIPEALGLLKRLKALFASQKFDAAVMVDSPALNLPIAKICRKNGIPVLYYIAPQTWAWGHRGWRNARVRKRVNRVACLWPFEEEYFRNVGINARYVGHPTFERLLANPVDDALVTQFKDGASPIITLLPGSREHVIREVLPGQLEVAHSLAMRFARARFLIVASGEDKRAMIEAMVARAREKSRMRVVTGHAERAAAIKAADVALVASGTVTLEVAWHGTPMIVMYNTNPWVYRLIGRWLITTPYFSLPNILAGRRIVPEFMPYYVSTDPITAVALEWLSTPVTLARVRKDLTDTIRPLIVPGAAKRAAQELASMLDGQARE